MKYVIYIALIFLYKTLRKLYRHDLVVVGTFNILLMMKTIYCSGWLCIISESASSTVPLSNITEEWGEFCSFWKISEWTMNTY